MRAARTLPDCTGCRGQLGFISATVDDWGVGGGGSEGATENGARERKDGGKQHGDGKAFRNYQQPPLMLLLGNDII